MKHEIEFAPGCFDDFDGTQEELDALVNELKSYDIEGITVLEIRKVNEDADPEYAEMFEDDSEDDEEFETVKRVLH